MRRLLPHFIALTLAGPSAAQPGPVGIGFAQAEEGTWWCRDSDAGRALACAREKCVTESGAGECTPTRWCHIAGWSALMVIWLPELHNTIPLCGAPSEAAAIAALKGLCDNDEVVTRCDVVLVISPDGVETPLTGVGWPGPTDDRDDR